VTYVVVVLALYLRPVKRASAPVIAAAPAAAPGSVVSAPEVGER